MASGRVLRDYVWANGVLVAQVNVTGPLGTPSEQVVYLYTDHLMTPRVGTDLAGRVVWSWDGDAFGATAADADPDGDGTATPVAVRFPGQYWDAESGWHYNWHRYYDPTLGRYLTSDPIGLDGDMNTYSYAENNPLGFFDPTGKASTSADDSRISTPDDCVYYKRVCEEEERECRYPCWSWVQRACARPFLIPSLWGVRERNIDCIRACLINEDKKARKRKRESAEDCDCLEVEVIDDYHNYCYSKCGVNPTRYPGLEPFIHILP